MKKQSEDFYCIGCGKPHKKSAFYISYNDLHNGVLPYCKKYIKEYVYENDKVNIVKFKKILRQMDKPFIIDWWVNALEGDVEPVGSYIQRTSIAHARSMTWADSVFGDEERDYDEEGKPRPENYEELVLFWGEGFDNIEYEYLEDKLEEYTTAYDCDTPVVEELFKQAAFESLEIRRKRQRREDASKNLKNLQDIMGSANIKPAQYDESQMGKDTFGTLIKKWENEKPIPEPLDEWKDKNYIEKYVRTWFFGHLARMIGAANPFKDEYDEIIQENTVDFQEEDDGDE